MSQPQCPRESDVLRAVACQWRGEHASGVASHVEGCARCADVRIAAERLLAEHVRQAQAARVPTSAAMWWRLERRRAAEHAARAQRLTMAVQALVLAAALGAAVAAAQMTLPWLLVPGNVLAETWAGLRTALGGWPDPAPSWLFPAAVALGAWALLLPAALYVVLADE